MRRGCEGVSAQVGGGSTEWEIDINLGKSQLFLILTILPVISKLNPNVIKDTNRVIKNKINYSTFKIIETQI